MEIENLSLPATNRFATEYMEQTESIQKYFHYRYQNLSDYKDRYMEIMKRSFMRKELAEHIEKYMSRFPGSEMVKTSLEKLKLENSAVIIGGQQAGILTGPLYTIHKIISIIALAKQKEKELNIPVVPIFWIAGEDHDYNEVNHVYIEKDYKIEKRNYPDKIRDKRMVSDIKIDQDKCLKWIEEILQTYGETKHTKELLRNMKSAINQSETFVDFFANLIMQLFKDAGLLIIDSGNPELRRLEKDYFIKQLDHFKEITLSVLQQQEMLRNDGFSNTIEMNSTAANIFYYDHEYFERILLEYDENEDCFLGKNGEFQISREKLLDVARDFPEKLSNNVVTRPLMQEWLFPTLAFIAGPGEIAYWAELKRVFEQLDLKMPPIVPRLNITLVDRSVETDLNELEMNIKEVLVSGNQSKKDAFLQSISDPIRKELILKTKQDVVRHYDQLELHLQNVDPGSLPLLKKNKALLFQQIEFMDAKLERAEQLKYETVLHKFAKVENMLRPMDAPQERILNSFYFINQYGYRMINDLLECTYSFDGTHKLIRL